jgi:hypothetical protein
MENLRIRRIAAALTLLRGRRAIIASGLAALLAVTVYWYVLEYRPWEEHYRLRPASWWSRELAGDGQPPSAWRKSLERVGIPLPDPHAAQNALEADPAAAPVLVELLQGADNNVRASASSCLRELGPRARHALPALLKVVHGPDKNAGAYALDAAACIDAGEVVPELADVVAQPNPFPNNYHRAWCVLRLAEAGPRARRAVPVLLSLLGDRDKELRIVAREALEQIDPAALAAYERDHPGANGESGR